MKPDDNVIYDHIADPRCKTVSVRRVDKLGSGGAHHVYMIDGFDNSTNPSVEKFLDCRHTLILFQNGSIKEVGINGITEEALLAIVTDRLRSFQGGKYACKENACALTHIEEALMWLNRRTIERMRRGVEGTRNV